MKKEKLNILKNELVSVSCWGVLLTVSGSLSALSVLSGPPVKLSGTQWISTFSKMLNLYY